MSIWGKNRWRDAAIVSWLLLAAFILACANNQVPLLQNEPKETFHAKVVKVDEKKRLLELVLTRQPKETKFVMRADWATSDWNTLVQHLLHHMRGPNSEVLFTIGPANTIDASTLQVRGPVRQELDLERPLMAELKGQRLEIVQVRWLTEQ